MAVPPFIIASSIAADIVAPVVASRASILDSVVVPLLSDNIALPLPISKLPLAFIRKPASKIPNKKLYIPINSFNS